MSLQYYLKKYFFVLTFFNLFFCNHLCFSRTLTAPKVRTIVTPQVVKLNSPQDILCKELEDACAIELSSDSKKYYSDLDKVDGWFDRRLIVLLLIIDDFQARNKIVGNLGEIGVWQGKSFIPLMHLAKRGESVAAIDCFESYEFNRDNSGGLCKTDNFMKNIKTYCSNPEKLKIIKGDSSLLTSNDYLKAMGNNKKFRIFSIDGCHEAHTTELDMKNAYAALADGGVIVTDDYFHWCWPGVSEGVNAFMHKNVNGLKPFFIGMNKIFFARPDYAKKYFDAIKEAVLPEDFVIKKFFNVDTLIYDPHN